LPKLVCASAKGSTRGTYYDNNDPKLLGDINEAKISINGKQTTALLDTGSCVSVMCESFFQEHMPDTNLQPLTEILNIECADGQPLPYLGCIEAEINVPDGLDKADSVHCLFLVAPDTKYSTRTPIILGTNILGIFLENCKATCGTRFLQTAKLHSPWYLSFRTIVTREKNLQRNKSKLAVVRCAVLEKIQLKPNETRNIKAYAEKCLEYPDTVAIVHETDDTSLPEFVT